MNRSTSVTKIDQNSLHCFLRHAVHSRTDTPENSTLFSAFESVDVYLQPFSQTLQLLSPLENFPATRLRVAIQRDVSTVVYDVTGCITWFPLPTVA